MGMKKINQGTKCLNCGRKMKNWINPKNGKPDKYLWVCKCIPKNLVISVG